MTSAVRIIRSSQGSDDKLSLDLQREETQQLAEDLGVDELDTIDLGINTGFSSFTKGFDSTEEKIDTNPEIQQLVDNLKAGKYDYLLAYDDTRISRDMYFVIIRYAAGQGNTDLEFVEDIEIDTMTFWINRIVEQFMKLREMRKSREVLERRREQGYDEGRPPKGLTYDANSEYWVPDEEFEVVMRAIELREEGNSYSEIEDETGINRGTLSNIFDKKDLYYSKAQEYKPELLTVEA